MKIRDKYDILNNFHFKLLFIISLFSSYLIGLTHFDITNSLDWNKYEQYLILFTSENVTLTESQGTLYFFIITIFTSFHESILGPHNLFQVINTGIQLGNFVLYSTGLFGLFKLLKSYEVSQNNILISLSILNFFPPMLYLRLTMKPEIFAFCILPFAILLTKKIILKDNLTNSILLSALLAIILSTKGSIIGMTVLTFLVLFQKDLNILLSNKKLIFFTIGITFLLNLENFMITGKFIFENVVTSNYLNKAGLKFFYFVDLKLLLTDPYKHLHSNSFLSIVLLDTFNDYFDFFWDNDESYFIQNRSLYFNNFFIQKYLREYIGIFLTLFVYLNFLKEIVVKNKYKNYFKLPFIGYLVLVVNSLGFPSKNFDPETGDLFKVHYIAFLLAIAFVFYLVNVLNQNSSKRYLLILLLPIFIFFIGFPKSYDTLLSNQVIVKFNHSELCYLTFTQNENCRNKKLNTCVFDPVLYKLDYESEIRTIPSKSTYFIPIELEKDGKIFYPRSREECLKFYDYGFNYKSKRSLQIISNKIPFISISVLLSVILLSLSNLWIMRKLNQSIS